MSSDSEGIRQKIKDFAAAAAAHDSDNNCNVFGVVFGKEDPEQYAQRILRASASAEDGIASAMGANSGGDAGQDASVRAKPYAPEAGSASKEVPVNGGGVAFQAGGKSVPSIAESSASAASDERSAGAGGAGESATGDVAQHAGGGRSEQIRKGGKSKECPVFCVRHSSAPKHYPSMTAAAKAEYPDLRLNTAISRIGKLLKEGTDEHGCVWRRQEEAEGTLEQPQASPAPRSSEDVGDKRTRTHKPETQRYKPTSQSAKRSTPDTSGSRNSSASKKTCRHFQNAQSDGAGGSPAGNHATGDRQEGGHINDDIHRLRAKRRSGCEKPVEKVKGGKVVQYGSRVQAGAAEFPDWESNRAGLQITKLIKDGKSGYTDLHGYLWRDCSEGGRADGDGASGWGNHASFEEGGRFNGGNRASQSGHPPARTVRASVCLSLRAVPLSVCLFVPCLCLSVSPCLPVYILVVANVCAKGVDSHRSP